MQMMVASRLGSDQCSSGGGCPRGHWKPSEDDKLRRLVQQHGPQNWNFIAEKLHGRSGKSCRLRWFNQLDPKINRRQFTEEEEEKLLSAHKIHGNKWAHIARLFPGRTDNAVKNHWHVIMSRKQKEQSRMLAKKNCPLPPPRGFHDRSSTSQQVKCSEFYLLDTSRMLDFQSNIKDGIFSFTPSKSSCNSSSSDTLVGGRRNCFGSGSKHCIMENPILAKDAHNSICRHVSEYSLFGGYKSCNGQVLMQRSYEGILPRPFGKLGLADAWTNDEQPIIKRELPRYGDSPDTFSLIRSNRQQDDESIRQKSIPFIDFLGVGISSS